MNALGWEQLDVILITGDAYIDAPHIGVALIGNYLIRSGYRVGVIAQPDTHSSEHIVRLGEPRLFWGITSGSVDSMVANYTALMKKRRSDDYTPGGLNTRRPDRAVIVYANLIRRYFKNTVPIVLGGIEASLRRIAHYDYWDDAIRRSVLFDAKADCIVYGMGERIALEIADRSNRGASISEIPGTCVVSPVQRDDYITLPSFENVRDDNDAFIEMFSQFYRNLDPLTACGMQQAHGDRYLLHHAPMHWETQEEMDRIHALHFERDAHPLYEGQGVVKALDTIRFSLRTHRGCYGECNFCAIAVHEGRTVRQRSEACIVDEARRMTEHSRFRGVIQDVGGPTANMYGFECERKMRSGACSDKRCMFPTVCEQLPVHHGPFMALLDKLRSLPAVRHVFVASGIRHDLLLCDERCGMEFLEQLAQHHVSGGLKLAPEHSSPVLLSRMGKGSIESLPNIRQRFMSISKRIGKKQHLTYYFIAAYPGCDESDMRSLRKYAAQELRITPEQVQIFTPTPSTWASLMYHTGKDPFTGESLHVERAVRGKRAQKDILTKEWKTGKAVKRRTR